MRKEFLNSSNDSNRDNFGDLDYLYEYTDDIYDPFVECEFYSGYEKQDWRPKTPQENPRLYLESCVAKPLKFSSDWLNKIREANLCPECRGTGKRIIMRSTDCIETLNDCTLCVGDGEWISKIVDIYGGESLKKIFDGLNVFCPSCKNIAVKNGNAKYEQVNYGQRYICSKCDKQFVFLSRYKKELNKEEVIKLFCRNASCRTIEKMTKISRKTIRKWVIEWLGELPTQN